MAIVLGALAGVVLLVGLVTFGLIQRRKRIISGGLGEFIKEGGKIQVRCGNEKESPPNEEAHDWATGIEEFLRSKLDDAYIARFRNSAGLPHVAVAIESRAHRNLWNVVRTRTARLHEFLAELGR